MRHFQLQSNLDLMNLDLVNNLDLTNFVLLTNFLLHRKSQFNKRSHGRELNLTNFLWLQRPKNEVEEEEEEANDDEEDVNEVKVSPRECLEALTKVRAFSQGRNFNFFVHDGLTAIQNQCLIEAREKQVQKKITSFFK